MEIAVRPSADLGADVILVDAPCSELGALRRGPDARFRIRYADLDRLPRLQREILEGVLQFAKPGGRIVYATCTIRSQENEEVALGFEGDHSELVREPVGTAPDGFFRTFPHREGTDGFFAARWIVSGATDDAR